MRGPIASQRAGLACKHRPTLGRPPNRRGRFKRTWEAWPLTSWLAASSSSPSCSRCASGARTSPSSPMGWVGGCDVDQEVATLEVVLGTGRMTAPGLVPEGPLRPARRVVVAMGDVGHGTGQQLCVGLPTQIRWSGLMRPAELWARWLRRLGRRAVGSPPDQRPDTSPVFLRGVRETRQVNRGKRGRVLGHWP
jgi:hypothetical protein